VLGCVDKSVFTVTRLKLSLAPRLAGRATCRLMFASEYKPQQQQFSKLNPACGPAGFDKHYRVCRQARAGFAWSPNECFENLAGLKHGVKFTCRPPTLRCVTVFCLQNWIYSLQSLAYIPVPVFQFTIVLLATYYGIFESTLRVTNFYEPPAVA